MSGPFTFGAWGKPTGPNGKPIIEGRLPCLHCGKLPARRKNALGANRLCYKCHAIQSIRVLYALAKGRPAGQPETEPDPRPERKPGDKSHRCLICMQWACDQPLKRCGDCQKDYDAAWELVPKRIKLVEVRGQE